MQDLCYLAHKGVRGQGITADSVKAWFCIRLTIYGMLKISFNASKVWYGSDIQQNDYVKKLMPHDFFRVHNRFMHFEDNEGSSVPDEDLPNEKDRQWKTRVFRDLVMKVVQDFFILHEDLIIDEKVCDTHSKKVYNRIRCRFKPGENEGVLWECLCDASGYLFNMEEANSDSSRDNSAGATCERLCEPVIKQGGKHHKVIADSKYADLALMDHLKSKGIYITTTIDISNRTARKGTPNKEVCCRQVIYVQSRRLSLCLCCAQGKYLCGKATDTAGKKLPAGLNWSEWSLLQKGDKHIMVWADQGMVQLISNWVRAPRASNGPYHIGLRCEAVTKLQMALITSGCALGTSGGDRKRRTL